RDAMLEIGHLDVGNHAPLEAGHEPRFQPRDLGWGSVAHHNDLPATLIERVERVKELLLHGFLSLEEMDVIDEEEIGFAKAAAKIGGGAVLDRGDELVGELLGSDEGDACLGLPLNNVVTDRLHEVRFAEAGVAVNEKGVVDLAWRLCDGVRGGGGQLVRFPDDEVVERVTIA